MELTITSDRAYAGIRRGDMTPAMAGEYLREGRLDTRGFSDVLRALYPGDDLQKRLVDAFLLDSPDAVPASVARTVRNWLGGKTQPQNREDLFHIAFALELEETQADALLGFCTGYGIHYREGRDAVYGWFLRERRAYAEARDFFASLPPPPRTTQLPDGHESTGTQLTKEIQQDFAHARSTGELCTCYEQHLEDFGLLHLRAYHHFDRFITQLVRPQSAWNAPAEQEYSLEAVMQQCLALGMPSGKNRQRYSATQKLLKASWPNATLLKNIRLRKADVPRKLLLLLYIATENLIDDEYSEYFEDYTSMQDRLEDHWVSINAILADCGMPALDPRAPFDWLVLYALTAEDESMSERMEQVIDAVFGQGQEQGAVADQHPSTPSDD